MEWGSRQVACCSQQNLMFRPEHAYVRCQPLQRGGTSFPPASPEAAVGLPYCTRSRAESPSRWLVDLAEPNPNDRHGRAGRHIASLFCGPSTWAEGPDAGSDTKLTLTLTGGIQRMVRAALTSSLILGRRDHECVAEADMDEHRARLDALRTRPHTAWGERCATRTMPERPRRGRATPGHFQKPRRRRRSTSQKQGRIPRKRRLTGCAGLVDS